MKWREYSSEAREKLKRSRKEFNTEARSLGAYIYVSTEISTIN